MNMVILDTNVVLRFLLADDAKQSSHAKALFEAAEAGKVGLFLSHVALAELVWTLDSFFNFPRDQIGKTLRGLLIHDGVQVDDRDTALVALDRFSRVNIDFPDCYAAALAIARSGTVCSYDRDFRKFPEVVWQKPEEILKSLEPD